MINFDELPMRVGLGQFQELSDERLQFIKQCGCDDFQMNTPRLPGEARWEYEDIARLVNRGAEAGLRQVEPAVTRLSRSPHLVTLRRGRSSARRGSR